MLHNALEDILAAHFDTHLTHYQLPCTCDQCKMDILALVLNSMNPRYVTTPSGGVMVKSLYMDQQLQMDMHREITKAVQIVAASPHHAE